MNFGKLLDLSLGLVESIPRIWAADALCRVKTHAMAPYAKASHTRSRFQPATCMQEDAVGAKTTNTIEERRPSVLDATAIAEPIGYFFIRARSRRSIRAGQKPCE